MKAARLVILLTALLSLPVGAAQAAPAQDPQPGLQTLAGLLDAPLHSGLFRQQKSVAGLPLPLTSSGQFALVGQQLTWQTLEPFSAEIRFTDRAIEQWQEGQLHWSLSRAEQPVVAVVSELMRALVSGDLAALGRHFAVRDLRIDQGCWQLALSVRDVALAQALQDISAAGCARVEQLQVFERNGNQTRIELLQAAHD